MALSFLNVSVFADAALAVEGFDGEVGEKTTEQMPLENDPEKTSESVSTPTNDGASETPGQKDDGSLDSSTSDGLQNDAAALIVDTDDVTVKLTAAGALPEGARLTVDVAENDEGKTAMEKALEEGYGLYRIYRLGLVDESGDPLTLSGIDYRVTVTWRGTFAGEMKAYRIDGPETVTEITLEKPLTTQGDINPNALTFSTELLNAPFAFAMPTSEKEGDEPSEPADPTNPEQPVITGDENIDEGDGDNAENGNGSGKEGELPGTDNGDAGTGTDADVDAPEQPAPSGPPLTSPSMTRTTSISSPCMWARFAICTVCLFWRHVGFRKPGCGRGCHHGQGDSGRSGRRGGALRRGYDQRHGASGSDRRRRRPPACLLLLPAALREWFERRCRGGSWQRHERRYVPRVGRRATALGL